MTHHFDQPQDRPTYSVAHAARILGIPPATLSSWTKGRSYQIQEGPKHWEPLIALPTDESYLSFNNLIEAHALSAIRKAHRVPVDRIRKALTYAEERLGIDRLLLSKNLLVGQRNLFLNHLGELINLSRSGQLAMRKILESYLDRVDWDESGMPLRFYPKLPNEATKKIVIDPRLSFGRPVVAGKGISTSILRERLDAGESTEEIAADYDLARGDVEDAILFDRVAA